MKSGIVIIKAIHSLIFFYMAACLVYILYAAIAGDFSVILVIALLSIVFEGAVLLLNKGTCPLRSLAEKYGSENGAVTDIFLPGFIARNIFRVSFPLFILEVIFLAARYTTA